MGSTAALIVECAVVSCTVIGAGIIITFLDQSFRRTVLHSKNDRRLSDSKQ